MKDKKKIMKRSGENKGEACVYIDKIMNEVWQSDGLFVSNLKDKNK